MATPFTGLRRLDGALQKLQQLGILPAKREENPVVALVQEIQSADNDRALMIARTLHQASFFNDIVRSEVAQIEVGEAYKTIAALFDSILDDSRHIAEQASRTASSTGKSVGPTAPATWSRELSPSVLRKSVPPTTRPSPGPTSSSSASRPFSRPTPSSARP